MKHTKGTWIIEETPSTLWIGSANGSKVEDIVCSLEIGPEYKMDYNEKQFANAKLIAAAPDLLNALQASREMLGVFEDNGGHDGLGGKGYMACLNQIDNAIQKATE